MSQMVAWCECRWCNVYRVLCKRHVVEQNPRLESCGYHLIVLYDTTGFLKRNSIHVHVHATFLRIGGSRLLLLWLLGRYDEQAAKLASVTSQFASTQQALQEVQAEFGIKRHEQNQLKVQLESAQSQHVKLQAAKDAEVGDLAQQLAESQQSVQQLQVSRVL